MENSAGFRFYNSLTDFLSHENKNSLINYQFTGSPSIKDAIEAIGIPHTEVDAIVVNDSAVRFSYKLKHNDEAKVYPYANITSLTANSLTPVPVYPLRFIADVHAGKLAKALRMLGFDTVYLNNFNDQQLAGIAERENRIVLTRDVGLLKHKKIKWGYWLRSQHANEQVQEVVNRFHLATAFRPFEICIACNGNIQPVKKEEILSLIPQKTIDYFNEFYQCLSCRKVYWKGSHYGNMQKKIGNLIRQM